MAQSELQILRLTQGATMTNAYVVGDETSETAVVIDPAWDGAEIHEEAKAHEWRITNIWLTHAHFDHFVGLAELHELEPGSIPVSLHPDDHPLWRVHGGAGFFGMETFDPGPEPTIEFEHGMTLRLGSHEFEVRHTPGHSPGHVCLLLAEANVVFCGDLIFAGSVGRTDVPGADSGVLMESIRREILPLPDETRLLPGHGPETTVGRERNSNPFLQAGMG